MVEGRSVFFTDSLVLKEAHLILFVSCLQIFLCAPWIYGAGARGLKPPPPRSFSRAHFSCDCFAVGWFHELSSLTTQQIDNFHYYYSSYCDCQWEKMSHILWTSLKHAQAPAQCKTKALTITCSSCSEVTPWVSMVAPLCQIEWQRDMRWLVGSLISAVRLTLIHQDDMLAGTVRGERGWETGSTQGNKFICDIQCWRMLRAD